MYCVCANAHSPPLSWLFYSQWYESTDTRLKPATCCARPFSKTLHTNTSSSQALGSPPSTASCRPLACACCARVCCGRVSRGGTKSFRALSPLQCLNWSGLLRRCSPALLAQKYSLTGTKAQILTPEEQCSTGSSFGRSAAVESTSNDAPVSSAASAGSGMVWSGIVTSLPCSSTEMHRAVASQLVQSCSEMLEKVLNLKRLLLLIPYERRLLLIPWEAATNS